MKEYSFNFFFPTQPGSRQEHTVRMQGSNPAIAFGRAWRVLRRDPKYKGRKGLENMRVGVVLMRAWSASGSEVAVTDQT